MLNWQYLKYFAAVAQEEHFTNAAAKLFITQPALSKAMDKLEKEIGVPLFIKQGRNVKLTPFGKVLKEQTMLATQTIEDALIKINAMATSETGTIRVSSIFTLGSNFVPQLLSEYMEQYNKVHLHYTQKATADIIRDVIDEGVDIGFCGEFVYDEFLMNVERKLILTEELFVVVSMRHKLAGAKSVRFRDIMEETFIGWNDSTGIALSIANALKNNGITTNLNTSFSATEDNTVAEMARQGFGIALLANVSSINMKGLHRIKISDIQITRAIYMIWKKDAQISSPVRSFMDFVIHKHSKELPAH